MISKLDKKTCTMVGIIMAAALLAGFYMLYYEPSQKKIAEIRKNINTKENEIRNAKIQVASFELLKSKVAKLEEQLGELRTKIATSGEIISLIKTIEDEALRLDLKVINMYSSIHEPPPIVESSKGKKAEVTPENQGPTFTKTVLNISLRGKYDKLEAFMDTIQHLETFLIVDGLDISSAEKTYPRLTSNVKINLYNEKGVDNDKTIN